MLGWRFWRPRRAEARPWMLLGLTVLAFISNVAPSAAESVRGRLYDRRTGETVGEIRQPGERHYDVYDRRGNRKAYHIRRGDVTEFYDARTSRRLPIEIRRGR